MFAAAGIAPAAEKAARLRRPARRTWARSIPISGGLLRTAGIDADILQNSVLVTEGKDRVLPALRELAEGKSKAACWTCCSARAASTARRWPTP